LFFQPAIAKLPMMNKKIPFLLLSLCAFVSCLSPYKGSDHLSNGLVEVRIDSKSGSFTILDSKKNRTIMEDAKIGFSIADYLELNRLSENQIETDGDVFEFGGSQGSHRIAKSGIPGAFPGGESLSLYSRKEDVGELEIIFTLYPDMPFVDIGFAFKNDSKKPVRLRTVDVANSPGFLNGSDKKDLLLLNGDSGAKDNQVKTGGAMQAENNILCFIADREEPRSLVMGGLRYADYRKYVNVDPTGLRMYAADPVGKKIDPGAVYRSEDHFYIEGCTPNPFESLEAYAAQLQKAHDIHLNYYTFPSVCLWFLAVKHFGGDDASVNNTVGAVKEMDEIVRSGFLKYGPVAVRLVPDCYEQSNEQGWWDDRHWQMHGRKERCLVEHHYEKPYETTRKWAAEVLARGGIPITYFQPGIRSEDYAEAFPGHMLYDRAHKYILENGKIVSDPHPVIGDRGVDGKPGYGKKYQEAYDFTDREFSEHWRAVNRHLKEGGVKGVFYDYPDRALPVRGGMDDRYSTALSAYLEVFRIAREELGDGSYLQERMGPGSDATLPYVSSVRTADDNNTIRSRDLTKVALRWYKNRRLTNYDMDGKALLRYGDRQENEITETQRRTILTLSYVTTGRLLLTESFRRFSKEVLGDLSRVFPFHASCLSARPLDAFTRSHPSTFDFPISDDWHQLVLYNDAEDNRLFEIALSGNTAWGALGLDAEKEYYAYDFWNDKFAGKTSGGGRLRQAVLKGESRVLSLHAVENRPQWLSTDRHIMQGYVDLVEKPTWDESNGSLSGKSALIGGETSKITFALNGYWPAKVEAPGADVSMEIREDNPDLADLFLKTEKSGESEWRIYFAGQKEKRPDRGKAARLGRDAGARTRAKREATS
jgi:hypothetical protein